MEKKWDEVDFSYKVSPKTLEREAVLNLGNVLSRILLLDNDGRNGV